MLSDVTEGSLHEKCSKIMKSITDLPFVECGIPRALLTAIIESNKSSIKALSLRALATVCINGDAVKQFEEVSLVSSNFTLAYINYELLDVNVGCQGILVSLHKKKDLLDPEN